MAKEGAQVEEEAGGKVSLGGERAQFLKKEGESKGGRE